MPRVKKVNVSETRLDRVSDQGRRDHGRLLRLQDTVDKLETRLSAMEDRETMRGKAGRPPVLFDTCFDWLADLLKSKGACRSSWVIREGEKFGFKPALVRRVARELQVDVGVGRVWRLMSPDRREKIPSLVLGHRGVIVPRGSGYNRRKLAAMAEQVGADCS